MKQPSVYLKMRVLGAIDTAPGRTRHERILNVAAMTFLDEEGNSRQFTWRTIQTWFYRYKNHGITGMTNHSRKDKGQTRKVTPEELLEALNAAKPHFHNQCANKRALYRFCIEKSLLDPDRIAQTTFYRLIRDYNLLAADESGSKPRLAFSMKYANQLWQADTMFGPYVDTGMSPGSANRPNSSPSSTTPAGSFATASSSSRKTSTLWSRPSAPPSTNAASPNSCSSITAPSTAAQEITLICARVGCILRHTAVRDAAAKGKIERFFRRVRDQFLVQKLDLSSLEALNRQFSHWVENDYNATAT